MFSFVSVSLLVEERVPVCLLLGPVQTSSLGDQLLCFFYVSCLWPDGGCVLKTQVLRKVGK